MADHVVGAAREILPGGRKIVEVAGLSIGVFNVHGRFYALKNRCPHQAGPLCLGSIKGMTLPSAPGEYIWARDGEILRCPWHGWEFEIATGRAVCEPERTRVRTYEVTVEPSEPPRAETVPVTVEDGLLVLHLR
jgi:nitrite reductase/ring-hydroxylating ferredoxin subunit